jgi:vacuolar-type H+-ATPase subunit E/Vma4
MRDLGSLPALVAAIGEEATAEIERMEQRRDDAAARLAGEHQVSGLDGAEREARLQAARQAAAEELRRDDWESVRIALERRQDWIARVQQAAARCLDQAAHRLDVLAALAVETLAAMPDRDCTLLLSAADVPRVDAAWIADVARRAGRDVRVAAGPQRAGCLAASRDGALVYDNSIEGRERRAYESARVAAGRLYAEAALPVPAVAAGRAS